MALKRKFGNKVYHWESQHHNEARAKGRAERLRRSGMLARVVKVDWMTWEVWSREK